MEVRDPRKFRMLVLPTVCLLMISNGAFSQRSGCDTTSCQNGATCQPIGTTDYICSCAQGYAGRYCESDTGISACAGVTCANGANRVKRKLLDIMSSEDIQRYFDVPTIDRVPEYDIVSPYIQDESGRRRRDIDTQDEIKEIKLQAFGEDYHMRLKENKYLVADGLAMEQLHANGTVERIPLEKRKCFYIGQLITHNVSTVAVSTCKGMMGIIAMEEEHLFIRPLSADHAAEYRRRRRDADNPHIIYRRSVTDDTHEQNVLKATNNTHFCGLDQDYYENAAHFNDAVKLSKHTEKYVEKSKSRKSELHSVGKRAVGCDVKFLEIRLMVDRDMVNYYRQDVMGYTLTLMNIVAARYAEPSLGTLVHLHIVKFETIMTDFYSTGSDATLRVSVDGESTLESLATFQRQSYIHDDNDPNHWDVAILVTRKNLQYQGSDSLQGIAFEDGTCDPDHGAGVVEDSGLSSGQIIAHEIGHTFGMSHDGGGTNTFCRDKVNVMSSSRPIGAGAFKWSTCSQQNFDSYLSDSARSSCLDDTPNSVTTHPINSGTYPGYQLITADEQCKLLSNRYTGVCLGENIQLEEICERLTCRSFDNRCNYQTTAAEGTACGNGRWCVSGACVASAGNFPTRVDGGWSSWTSNSQCSRTCGGGVRTRTRCCDSPKPQHGGNTCTGESSDAELCNTHTCTTSQPDFAQEQCAATANEPWQGGFYTWEAYFQNQTEQELCAFKCLNNAHWVVPRGPAFQDGTRCSVDRRNELNKCVQGNCVEFGCDNKLGSNQRFDNCRVCGGSGTSCVPNNGFYSDGTPYELTAFLDIPADSTSIEISNTSPLTSFMALKTINGQYLFGNGNQPVSGEYYSNGIFVKYFYAISSEDIIIDGPTPVAYVAEVYRADRNHRPTITYSYYTPSGVPPPPPPTQPPAPTYYWQTTEGPCSVTCGRGTQQVSAQCFSPSTGTTVTDAFCSLGTRPVTTQQQCILTACPTPAGPSNYWMISFGQCSVTCGTGTKAQTAICHSPSLGRTVADSECDPNTRPSSNNQECFEQICNYWIESEGGCSVTCGFGTAARFWRCFSPSSSTIVSDNQCNAAARPADTQQSCFPQQCNPIWITFPYGDCDATCGESYQTRTVQCAIPNGQSHTQVDDSLCANQPKPDTTIPCNQYLSACGVWHVGSWSQCSVTCWRGFQFRTVVCRPDGWEAFLPNPPTLNDAECRESKPSTLQQCDTGVTCQTTDYYWVQGVLRECSVTCGTGVATRQILCIESIGGSTRTVADSFCQGLASPPTQEDCVQPACQGVWQEMRWRQCSRSCGPGSQSRQVLCRPEGYESMSNPPILPNFQCNADNKPISQRPCTIMLTCPSLTTPSTGIDNGAVDPRICNCPSDVVETITTGTYAQISWTPPTICNENGELEWQHPQPPRPPRYLTAGQTQEITYTFTDLANGRSPVYCRFQISARGPIFQQPCNPNPCQNGGACQLTGTTSYFCRCASGFTGTNCEVTVAQPCNPSPCQNGAVACTPRGNSYLCSCAPGYYGTNCQHGPSMPPACPDGSQPVNCFTNPCEVSSCPRNPNARCVPNYCGGCNAEFYDTTGSRVDCSVPVPAQPCNPNPCQNRASCTPRGSSYLCSCAPGYSGTNCQVTVVQPCNPSPCQNGATCQIRGNDYSCSCASGYTGTNCDQAAGAVDPRICNCPSDVVETITAGTYYAQISWTPPTICNENGGSLQWQHPQPPRPPRYLTAGQTQEITYTFTDLANGRRLVYCRFQISARGPTSVGRKRRDTEGTHPCQFDPCGPDRICLETGHSNDTYECYTAADDIKDILLQRRDNDRFDANESERESTIAVVEGLSIATISTLMALIIVIIALVAIIYIATRRLKSANKSVEKQALAYQEVRNV